MNFLAVWALNLLLWTPPAGQLPVSACVDRVEGPIVVLVFEDPPDRWRELSVPSALVSGGEGDVLVAGRPDHEARDRLRDTIENMMQISRVPRR